MNIVRTQYAFGLFLTKNIMAKVEYVNQKYNGYLATQTPCAPDSRAGGVARL